MKLFLITNFNGILLLIADSLLFYGCILFYTYNMIILFGITLCLFVFTTSVLKNSISGSKIRRRMYFSIIKILQIKKEFIESIIDNYNSSFCNTVVIYCACKDCKVDISLKTLIKRLALKRKMAKQKINNLTNI